MNTLPPLPKGPQSKLDLPSTPSTSKNRGDDVDVQGPDEDNGRIYYLDPADPVDDDPDEEDLIFEEVPVEEFQESSDDEEEETLEHAVRSINEKAFFGVTFETTTKPEELTPTLTKRPEVIDDYIRNFLSSKGLVKSLDAFQNEWYEFLQKGALSTEDTSIVPDVYQRNQELADALQKLRVDVENYKDIASKARSTYDKLRKERDFHRMHHKRVVQEKNKLISDIKRLKKHYESYEPTLKQLQHKYEVAMKEKMLTKLERDRLAGRVVTLESSLKTMEKNYKDMPPASRTPTAPRTKDLQPSSTAPTYTSPSKKPSQTNPRDATLPAEDRPNPYTDADLPTAKTDRLRQIHAVRAHDLAVSSVKFHPKKMILATVSDDKTWKMWAFPSGELIMSGSGHKDWIADCDFHPRGAHLATASGDSTVKIWDFSKGSASLTLTDHTQAVWSCAFHDTGDFIATCSMDHTAKLFDLHTGRCRQTFRGHADSVNHVGFQPYTNTLFTCSGDKTISLWDARTGLCSQTLYGHANAVNCVAFSMKGDTLTSCDADGLLKFWDIRAVSELHSVNLGPYPANKLSLDPSGSVVAVASNDGSVRVVTNHGRGTVKTLEAHDDACQGVAFDRTGEWLVSAGSDCTYHIFQ
ncbi:Sperm-associated antigen 16 protein [Rhizophlyctis rosea]|uniref:Sperm-associated antigen 16 protein n=1 Tax=Rhizophlyctis rosea TaxID=64517 RepID=A0AAD5X7A9_9FUNG|nr:Sperm-associated antigen 16 protein [Rhizophlyctis rosea]